MCASSSGSGFSRFTYFVVRGFGGAILRRLGGGGPSVLTQISSVASGSFKGDALPEGGVVELGEGYLLEASRSISTGGSDGDLDRTDSGDDGGDEASMAWGS